MTMRRRPGACTTRESAATACLAGGVAVGEGWGKSVGEGGAGTNEDREELSRGAEEGERENGLKGYSG